MRRWFTVIAIACVAFIAIHLSNIFLEEFALRGTKAFAPIKSFEYINGNKKNDLTDGNSDWTVAENNSKIIYDRDEKYTLIKIKVKTDDYYNAVCIKTDNSVLSVECDGRMLLKYKNDRSYSDSKLEIIKLPASQNEQTLKIMTYSPYTFRFNAFMTNEQKATGNASLIKYADVIIGGMTSILAFAFLCLFLVLYSRERIKFRELYLPIILLLSGLIILLNPPFSILFSGNLASFKLSMALGSLLCVCVFLKGIIDKVDYDDFIESLGGLNIIYVLAIALSPYDILFSVLVKMFSLLLAVDMIAYIYIMVKHRVNSFSIIKESAFATFAICSFMYWYSVSQRMSINFKLYMIFSSVICVAVLSCFFITNKSSIIPKAKVNKRVLVSFLPQKIPLSEMLIVKRYAIPWAEKIRDLKLPDENAVTVFNEVENIPIEGDFSGILDYKLRNDIQHTIRVGEYSRVIALAMGYSAKRAALIGKAALLHDIGKLAVDYSILTKEGILTEEEFAGIKLHTKFGYEILSGQRDDFFKMAAIIARDHHERFNGSGYNHLKGKEIKMEARIVAVADVFDAMSSKRSYKISWGFEQVFDYILEHGGDFFDPKVTELFKLARNDLAKCYFAYHHNEPEISKKGVE